MNKIDLRLKLIEPLRLAGSLAVDAVLFLLFLRHASGSLLPRIISTDPRLLVVECRCEATEVSNPLAILRGLVSQGVWLFDFNQISPTF